MATIPQPIAIPIAAANTTLYTAFVGAATTAMLVSLDLTNTTVTDITVDLWWEDDDASEIVLFGDDITVPAKGTSTWRGIITMDLAAEKIRAIASVVGIDAIGTVMES